MNKKLRKTLLNASSALRALSVFGAITAVGVTAAPVYAQDFTNVTATGRVTDAGGDPVSGATVSITSDDQGFTRTATTDSDGSYRVPNLPQGDYTFEVSAPAFATYSESGIALRQSAGGNSFRLVAEGAMASGAGDAIVVTGQRVRVSDFDRATVGAVVNVADVAGRVPIARDLTSVILLAPGTTQGDSAFGNLPALSGSSVSENTYFLNGLNVTDFRQGLGAVEVPFVFYDTVEVKNGGVPAEFGRFTGGFVNAISKSGSNDFHGGVLVNYQPSWGFEKRPNTLIDYNTADFDETVEVVANLSGPIWKDRLFFYGFYQHNYHRFDDLQLTVQPNTVLLPATDTRPADIDPTTGQPVTSATTVAPYSTGFRFLQQTERDPYFGGKLDFIPFDGHRLEFTYFDSGQTNNQRTYAVVDADGGAYDSRVDDRPFQGGATATTVSLTGGENYIGRYTGQFTDWLTLSAAYGRSERRDTSTSSNPDYPFISDTAGLGITGNPTNLIEENDDTRKFYRADADIYVNLLGSHHFKFGYDREELTSNQLTSYTGDRAITYVNSGSTGDTNVPTPDTLYFLSRTFRNGGTFDSVNEAAYIQDSWSLFEDRITLNLGLRWDKFTNDNVAGETYFDSGDQFAPRIAFTADPFGDGLTKFYGSFGRYYLPIPSNTNIRLAGAEFDYDQYFLVDGINPDGTPIPGAPVLTVQNGVACPNDPSAISPGTINCNIRSDGTPTPTIATVAQNLTPQSVDEYVLGLERNIGNGMTVGIFGIHRSLNESLEDAAIDAAVNAYCEDEGISGCSDIWSSFHQYVLINPGADQTITLSDPLPGETELRTVDFTAAQLGYPQARRTYWAGTVTFDREFDGLWSANASYTYSELKGNVEGGIRSDNGQTDSGLTTAFDQPGLTDGTYGFLPGHAKHQFKFFGSYQPFDFLTLGAQFQAISPRKFGCIGRVPANRDSFAGAYGAAGFYCNVDEQGNVITDPNYADFVNDGTDTSLSITPRGSQLKSDWNIFTNLSAIFRLPTDAFESSLRVDVFNVFNQKAVTDIRELGTQGSGRPRGDYGTPLNYQQPRYVRFQFSVDF